MVRFPLDKAFDLTQALRVCLSVCCWQKIGSKIAFYRHYPVGVLFDLLSDNELPWSITVHFQNFPTDQLLRLSNSGTSNTRSYFMNSLKESTYVKQNGIKVINDFGIKESDSIWEGLYDGHFEKFFNVSNLIVQQTNQIPVRILRPNFPIMQYPCEWKNSATGEMVTLGQALNSCKLGLNLDSPESEILVQGIRPPMETPLFWMSQHLSHPDGFLYIVIKD